MEPGRHRRFGFHLYGNGSFTDTNIDGLTNRFYQARSGSTCSQVIGFINMTILPGTNLIANQLYQVNDGAYPQNTAERVDRSLGTGVTAVGPVSKSRSGTGKGLMLTRSIPLVTFGFRMATSR